MQNELTERARLSKNRPIAVLEEEVTTILSTEPQEEQVTSILSRIQAQPDLYSVISPSSTRFFSLLLKKTLPDFQSLLLYTATNAAPRTSFLTIICSVAGINAVVSHIKLSDLQDKFGAEGARLLLYLDLLEAVLQPVTATSRSWRLIQTTGVSDVKKQLLWKEWVRLVGSGTILSTVAQAEDVLHKVGGPKRQSWLSIGSSYAIYIARSVWDMVRSDSVASVAVYSAAADLLSKTLSLGYPDVLTKVLTEEALIAKAEGLDKLSALIGALKHRDQVKTMVGILKFISAATHSTFQKPYDVLALTKPPATLNGSIKLLDTLVSKEPRLQNHLTAILTDPPRNQLLSNPYLIRVIIASLKLDANASHTLLEKCWNQFNDHIYIRHSSAAEQEVLTQILLLLIGLVHRAQPMALFMIAKSSQHTSGTSKRIASSNEKVRVLGMIVAAVVSRLVDKAESRLVFNTPDMQTKQAKWYLTLPSVDDHPGDLQVLTEGTSNQDHMMPTRLRPDHISPNERFELEKDKVGTLSKQMLTSKTIGRGATAISSLRITEVDSDDDSGLNSMTLLPSQAISKTKKIMEIDINTSDLIPYAKADSDPEDDSSDPTLVTRDRPKAPVYIRDLLKNLADSDNMTIRTLALQTAPSLIRRKANFGSEVSDNAEHLAIAVANLSNSDDFDVEDEEAFLKLRERTLRALLVAQPSLIGKWLGEAVVRGEYSIQQKLGILVAIGLGAREIAGLDKDTEGHGKEDPTFPSKRLTGRMEEVWAGESAMSARIGQSRLRDGGRPLKGVQLADTAIDNVAVRLSRTMLEPMALEAADALTGPNVLKVRTFSSRLQVERTRKKPGPNKLSPLVADSFFYPLLGAFGGRVATSRASSPSSPHILPTYIRTLTLVLHAAGAACPALPQLTTDYWPVLLMLRSSGLVNPPVNEAILFSLLTLLELNAHRQDVLVRDHAKLMLESQEWARLILDNEAAVSGEDLDRVRMLAAGVITRCAEIFDKHRRSLLGQ